MNGNKKNDGQSEFNIFDQQENAFITYESFCWALYDVSLIQYKTLVWHDVKEATRCLKLLKTKNCKIFAFNIQVVFIYIRIFFLTLLEWCSNRCVHFSCSRTSILEYSVAQYSNLYSPPRAFTFLIWKTNAAQYWTML